MNKNPQNDTLAELPKKPRHEMTIDEYYDSLVLLPKEERERRRQGTKCLRDQLASLPWYAKRAEISGEIFWINLYWGQIKP